MALRNLVFQENELLRKKSRPVEKIDERLLTLLDDMAETMYASDGVGLASPQVGVLKRVFVVDLRDGNGLTEFINPVLTNASGTQTGVEGCLSCPGVSGEVERPQELDIEATDREGNQFHIHAEGYLAVCVSHENDHLDGILFIDKTVGEQVFS